MKIAFFDTKPYDKVTFTPIAEKLGVEINYFDEKLTKETAHLAKGYDASCSFVNDNVSAEAVQTLKDLRDLWSSKDPELARERFQEILVTYEALAPKSMEVLEAGFDDAIAVLHLPTKYRRRLRSTNSLERLNQEIRRRERVIRIFPSGESAIRLMGALLAQQSETWLSGRKWLDMAEYWKELIPKDESAEVKQAA